MSGLEPWQRDFLILVVLAWSNFLPILGRVFLGPRLSGAVDLGACWFDGRPLFGPHKTWRGLVLSLGGAWTLGLLLPMGPTTALQLALFSMAGDLLSGFLKRRLGIASGEQAPGLDQGLEALVPLWALKDNLGLGWGEIALLIASFWALDRAVSPVLFRIRIRRRPR